MLSRITLDFMAAHPAEAAQLLEQQAPERLTGFVTQIDPGTSARIIAHMTPEVAAACLRAAESAVSVAILSALPVYLSSALLRRMPKAARNVLLDRLPGKLAVPLRLVLGFATDTVGAHADPNALAVGQDATSGSVIALARRAPESLRKYVYVLDARQRLIGTVDARECFLANRTTKIRALAADDPTTLRARATLTEVVDEPAWEQFNVLPVVDRGDAFIGALTRRMLIHALRSRKVERAAEAFTETAVNLADLYWDGATSLIYRSDK